MDTAIALPAGLTARACVPADAPSVTEVVAAAELHDLGEVMIELAEVVGDWQRPSFDLTHHSLAVVDGEQMVATAEVTGARRLEAAVRPGWRGRGIGTAMVRWAEECARGAGGTVLGQTVAVGGDAEAMFRALGYREGWTSWLLTLPEGAAIEPQPLPAGYALQDFVAGEDNQATYRVVEDAFNEWPGRASVPYGDWAARVVLRPGFAPWQIRLAVDAAGEVVGAAVSSIYQDTGFVDQLAVRADQRSRGLARALLVDAFARCRERGAARSELNTDSRTGARGLYEHVGMVVTRTWKHWQTDL